MHIGYTHFLHKIQLIQSAWLSFFLLVFFSWYVDFRLMLVADCTYKVAIFRQTVFTDECAKIFWFFLLLITSFALGTMKYCSLVLYFPWSLLPFLLCPASFLLLLPSLLPFLVSATLPALCYPSSLVLYFLCSLLSFLCSLLPFLLPKHCVLKFMLLTNLFLIL